MARKRASDRDLVIPECKDPERRRQLEEDDAAWLKFYLPDVFFNPFTDEQLQLIKECGRCLKYGLKQATADERGGGKSSTVKYLLLKYALSRQVRFPLVIAATHGKAGKTTSSLKHRLASKKPNVLCDDYPLECHVARYVNPWPSRARNVTANGQRPIHVSWGTSEGYFILPTWEDEEPIGPIIMALSWSSDELQGCNVFDQRPDFLMIDDLDSRDSLAAEQGVVADKIEEVLDKNVAGMKGQSGGLGQYFLCTITSVDAAAYRYTDPSIKPAWSGRRVRAVKTWPERMDLWHEYVRLRQKGAFTKDEKGESADPHGREAHQFYLDNREAMDEGAVVSNPYRFDKTVLPDGSSNEVSSLQRCFNFIADTSREAFDTEYQNDPPEREGVIDARVTGYHVSSSAGDFERFVVDNDVSIVARGVDVRKTELHYVGLGSGPTRANRIADYDFQSHGSNETTVEMAEGLILESLYRLADEWKKQPIVDQNGNRITTDITLIDKGWLGSWHEREDGELKTWATQPVETFCQAMGLRQWLPAKSQPKYRTPENPPRSVIVGDNWHINTGKGNKRRTAEVIFNAEHWHSLAEELFLLSAVDDEESPEVDTERFELFIPPDGIHSGHRRFGEHIREGADELAEMRKGKKKKRSRRNHWFDSLVMALVGVSVEKAFRERESRKKPKRSLSQMARSSNG